MFSKQENWFYLHKSHKSNKTIQSTNWNYKLHCDLTPQVISYKTEDITEKRTSSKISMHSPRDVAQNRGT